MRERILVTGAEGFLGRRLVGLLLHEGYEVVAVDRSKDPGLNVQEYLQGDIVRSKILRRVRPPISQIIHLASNAFKCVDQECLLDNVYSTITLTRHAKRWETNRILLASTSGVYQPPDQDLVISEDYPVKPPSLYPLTKHLSERVLQVSEVPGLILRFTYLYGENGEKGQIPESLGDIENGRSPQVRDESRDYLYVGEAAEAIIKALNYKGQYSLFHFGTQQLIPISTIIRKILELKGSRLDVSISGSRKNLALNSTRARQELNWVSSRSILNDLPMLFRAVDN